METSNNNNIEGGYSTYALYDIKSFKVNLLYIATENMVNYKYAFDKKDRDRLYNEACKAIEKLTWLLVDKVHVLSNNNELNPQQFMLTKLSGGVDDKIESYDDLKALYLVCSRILYKLGITKYEHFTYRKADAWRED